MDGLFGSQSWLYIILIGFIVGLLARAIMPGEQKMGLILTALLGIAGALVATFLGRALDLYPPGHNAQFVGALVGALVLLFVAGLIKKK